MGRLRLLRPGSLPLPSTESKTMANLPVEVLSGEEVERLLGTPDRDDVHGLRDAAALTTLYFAAATAVEAVALDLRDLKLETGTLRLTSGSGRHRHLDLEAEHAALLELYLSDSRPLIIAQGGAVARASTALFLANRAQRLQVQDLRQIFGASIKLAKVATTANLNTLRLSRAWHLRQQGVSPEAIQQLLGTTSRSGRRLI